MTDETGATPPRARRALWVLGAGLIAAALLLPTGWYDALPDAPGLPRPGMDGTVLLRISLALQGLVALWAGLRRWSFRPLREGELASDPPPVGHDLDRSAALGWVAAVTALAIGLRLHDLGADLWLDEISPLQMYGALSPLEVLGTYFRTNNHLLNTALVNLSVEAFGETERAVRLPAVTFGIATIPVLYWLGTLFLSRRASVGAALLLAVSYHHVFFSQNARGYSGYLLFSLLATGLFVSALRRDRAGLWAAFGGATVLNFAVHLNAGFVFLAHALVGVGWWAWVRFVRRRPADRLRNRLGAVFGVTALFVFQLYATVLPQMVVVLRATYSGASSGFAGFSLAFLRELARGITQGFGGGAPGLAVGFLLLAGAGAYLLWRRDRLLASALVLPEVATALYLSVRGYTFSPRFFLLGLPVAVLAAARAVEFGAHRVAERLLPDALLRDRGGRRAAATTLLVVGVLALSAATASALPRYYATPKQPYRAALDFVNAERGPSTGVVVVHLAERGVRYYREKLGLPEGPFRYVRSVEELESALAGTPTDDPLLVTTFHRALRIRHPDLFRRIRTGASRLAEFPASVGDGAITVWRWRDGARAGSPRPDGGRRARREAAGEGP